MSMKYVEDASPIYRHLTVTRRHTQENAHSNVQFVTWHLNKRTTLLDINITYIRLDPISSHMASMERITTERIQENGNYHFSLILTQ